MVSEESTVPVIRDGSQSTAPGDRMSGFGSPAPS